MLVEIMQPRTYHLASHVTERRKDQRPGNGAKNIQRQENFRRQTAGANQYRPDYPEAVHKTGANHEKIGTTFNQPLCLANARLMS